MGTWVNPPLSVHVRGQTAAKHYPQGLWPSFRPLLPLLMLKSHVQKVSLVTDQKGGHSTGEESTITLRFVQLYLDQSSPWIWQIPDLSGQTTEVFHAFLRVITVKSHRICPEGQCWLAYWNCVLAHPLPELQHKRGLAWALLFLSTKGNCEDWAVLPFNLFFCTHTRTHKYKLLISSSRSHPIIPLNQAGAEAEHR